MPDNPLLRATSTTFWQSNLQLFSRRSVAACRCPTAAAGFVAMRDAGKADDNARSIRTLGAD
jgi:hypothetical protein